MFTKILWRVLTVALLSLFISSQISFSSELVPLYPKGHKKPSLADDRLQFPSQPTDPLLAIQHVDENAEYYLGSGAADDTFFITFEPSAPCSVYFAEVQWFDAGNINAFAAYYSDEAYAMYPDGTAPDRGTSPVSPIGQWIAGPVPNAAVGSQAWEILDLGGTEFIIGDPVTMESEIFGVGYIKGSEIPHPLADRMDSKGIRYTYTWFGGPWMSTYPEDWGAYSSDLTSGTVIDLMMRVWVDYLWGMPIQISNVSQHCNTFNYDGPYTITCELLDDDPGITNDDDVAVIYTVDSGPEFSVPLSETAPGSGVFSADIPGQPVGSEIEYWVWCVDETGLESESFPMNFFVLTPGNPAADLMLLNEGLADRLTAYTMALDELEVSYEIWDVEENNGFDESVIEYGWNSILAAGWGFSSIPALDEPNPFTDFLDNGGNLALIDQDWFYAQSLPPEGTFFSGDFGYDYMGVNDYWNDFSVPDENYYGQSGDPLTSPWENTPYETYFDETGIHMNPANQWADWFTEAAAENIFWGENDGNSYGCRYDNGTFKTVFMSFMAEANCYIDPQGVWVPADDFTQLLTNIIDWFDVPFTPPVNQIEVTLTPFNPPIYIPENGGSFNFNIAMANQTNTG